MNKFLASCVTTFSFFFIVAGVVSKVYASEIITFVHQDHLSSTTLATNEQGEVVSRQSYYPYGTTRNTQGTLPTERAYTSQVSDTDTTGLYYYNARYYNPTIALFTQADTADDPLAGHNRYLYVGNNPIILSDPSGNCAGLGCLLNSTFRRMTNVDIERSYNEAVGAVNEIKAVVSSDLGVGYKAVGVADAASGHMLSSTTHSLNQSRQDVFFPDENTTFLQRLGGSINIAINALGWGDAVAGLGRMGVAHSVGAALKSSRSFSLADNVVDAATFKERVLLSSDLSTDSLLGTVRDSPWNWCNCKTQLATAADLGDVANIMRESGAPLWIAEDKGSYYAMMRELTGPSLPLGGDFGIYYPGVDTTYGPVVLVWKGSGLANYLHEFGHFIFDMEFGVSNYPLLLNEIAADIISRFMGGY